jgi:hypothetical protein
VVSILTHATSDYLQKPSWKEKENQDMDKIMQLLASMNANMETMLASMKAHQGRRKPIIKPGEKRSEQKWKPSELKRKQSE